MLLANIQLLSVYLVYFFLSLEIVKKLGACTAVQDNYKKLEFHFVERFENHVKQTRKHHS